MTKNHYFSYRPKSKETLSNGCIIERFELHRLDFDLSKLSYCFFCQGKKSCKKEDERIIGICDNFLEDDNIATGVIIYRPPH